MTSRMLEIGGGDHPVEGYEQINEGWGFKPLPFPDETFDEVYSAHTIEHVPWWLTEAAIAEARRVLKTGGQLEIHTVDFAYLVNCWMERRVGDKWAARGKNTEMHPMRWVASRIFSVAETMDDPNWHRAIFDYPYLEELLTMGGFVAVRLEERLKGPMRHGPINIGIVGVKS